MVAYHPPGHAGRVDTFTFKNKPDTVYQSFSMLKRGKYFSEYRLN